MSFRLLKPCKERFFASKSFFEMHLLSGRFHHFFIVACHLLRPKQMKKCGMTDLLFLIFNQFLPIRIQLLNERNLPLAG